MPEAQAGGKHPANNFSALKAFSAVIVIVAVIAGVYAMVEPMSQRIDFLERQLARHEDLGAHQGAVGKLSTIDHRFTEVETQMRWLADVANVRASNQERFIAILWNRTYEEELPATDYWPLGRESE